MTRSAGSGELLPKSTFDRHDVRFIGAVGGRYALNSEAPAGASKAPVYACRLCSVSTRLAVLVGPVVGKNGAGVTAHFDVFGILRGRINRQLPSGFVMDLTLNDDARDRLGRKIAWQKKRVHDQAEDRREHKRIPLRDPRTIVTMGDGERIPAFVIDVSQSGIALSAQTSPPIGTPLAVGKLVGRVVRHLDIGFAVKFLALQDLETVEALIVLPLMRTISAEDAEAD